MVGTKTAPAHKKSYSFLGRSCIAPTSAGAKANYPFVKGDSRPRPLEVVALVDNSASHSFIALKLVEKYHLTINLDTSMLVTLANGQSGGNVRNLLHAHNYIYYEQHSTLDMLYPMGCSNHLH